MRAVKLMAAFTSGGVLVFLLISLGVVDRVDGIPGTQEEPVFSLPTYLSFVSVMLTAVTVVLAAVAIGVGVVAAYTFQQLERRAENRVEELVKVRLSDEVIKRRVAEIAFATGNGELEGKDYEDE
ncbi:hypothetical protein CBW24_07890 [Pacificitalea manganoxidans]|uniref:Uncharacterized protein n=3 Tax=Pacificitalea manganoxidans TaxID=1411902 RepID=A0A291LZ31_9RHOB|nr:hypothetical protein CBW24_07890 [Pacificitalea manganoxidans]